MKRKGRNVDFLNVTEQKLNDIEAVLKKYAKETYSLATVKEHNCPESGITPKAWETITSLIIQGFHKDTLNINSTMNKIADYCNDSKIPLNFSLVYKLFIFSRMVNMLETIMSVDSLDLIPNLDIADQCEVWSKTMMRGMDTLVERVSEEEQEVKDQFDEAVEQAKGDPAKMVQIIVGFTEDVEEMNDADLLSLHYRLKATMSMSQSIPEAVKSDQLKHLDKIGMMLINKVELELQSRSSSN